MVPSVSSSAVALIFLISLSISSTVSVPIQDNFLQCFYNYFPIINTDSQVIYPQNTSSYKSILQSSISNLRFLDHTTPKPLFIITPRNESHIQASIICCRLHELNLRVRSGGHDYEGLSYLSLYDTPFILVDLNNLRSITVNLEDETMWVQSGATIGDVYYQIAQASRLLAFPAGACATVGVGGHFGGGGMGPIMRKYGLAADNIVDAYLIDADGLIHDRESMGEDVFWAIRGGGASSFGVILSWKIRLVNVPPIVTVFTITKTLVQGATKLVERWQHIAHTFDENLSIRVIIQPRAGVGSNSRTLEALFNSLFLGTVAELLPLMRRSFPELGLEQNDCLEMPWIESVLYFGGLPYGPGNPIDVLLDRGLQEKGFSKAKSDFVKNPISQIGLEGIWERLLEDENASMIMDPLGGRMSEISADEIPFPFRSGYLYNMQYAVIWAGGEAGEESQKHIDWIRRLYVYLGPHVSQSPRGAYLNYRDLDLGVNEDGNASYSRAMIWGEKYFSGNFRRLVRAKGLVDPTNFFRYEQSIPTLVGMGEENVELLALV